ncbi:MAG: hypothetical protein J2P36_04950 [Ktedonobacteraceae bacterium]|nr:hypothetical protein [Ktedonobacteraceae bacterium]
MQEHPEHHVIIWNEQGDSPTGPIVTRYSRSGNIYIGGLRADLLSAAPDGITLGTKIETSSEGVKYREYKLRPDQYYHLLYGYDLSPLGESRVAFLEAQNQLLREYLAEIKQAAVKAVERVEGGRLSATGALLGLKSAIDALAIGEE